MTVTGCGMDRNSHIHRPSIRHLRLSQLYGAASSISQINNVTLACESDVLLSDQKQLWPSVRYNFTPNVLSKEIFIEEVRTIRNAIHFWDLSSWWKKAFRLFSWLKGKALTSWNLRAAYKVLHWLGPDQPLRFGLFVLDADERSVYLQPQGERKRAQNQILSCHWLYIYLINRNRSIRIQFRDKIRIQLQTWMFIGHCRVRSNWLSFFVFHLFSFFFLLGSCVRSQWMWYRDIFGVRKILY